ncbi:hypothetical protein BD410DRAFT_582863 [Rickenella mellea]|uniref:CFEM domain-containing protein n=1 Tax=Rickenella mellea TaxID=50990 RepID=A0A4Y7PHX5_9AGAM|nr:hypothetical protein BD410DRAFT_278320 [Rickenella mellea]TDL17173.1 hypothetical protein BD410DRAFT_582863 [Rickenella mellea]
MKGSSFLLGASALGVALLGVQTVEAQASPACLTTCETTAAKAAGCSGPTDNTCVCTSQPFLSAVDSCLSKVCSQQDQPAALRALQQQCASFTASGPPASSPSGTGTGTGTPPPQPITTTFTTVITSILTPGPTSPPSPSPTGGLSTIPPPLSAPSVNPPSASDTSSSSSSLTSPPILTPPPTSPTSESALSTSTVTIIGVIAFVTSLVGVLVGAVLLV